MFSTVNKKAFTLADVKAVWPTEWGSDTAFSEAWRAMKFYKARSDFAERNRISRHDITAIIHEPTGKVFLQWQGACQSIRKQPEAYDNSGSSLRPILKAGRRNARRKIRRRYYEARTNLRIAYLTDAHPSIINKLVKDLFREARNLDALVESLLFERRQRNK